MLKKIKSIFVVEDSSAPKASSTSSGDTKGDTNPPMSEIDLTIPAPNNIPESSSENRFLSILAQAIEKNNQQGFDYFEFRQSLINLSKLNMDEMTKYKSAYAAAQAMGVSPATLVDSAKFYLGLLNDEGKKFSIAEQNQRTKVVEDRKNELTQIASEIQKKQEMIIQLQSEVEKLNKILEDKKQDAANMAGKLEHTKNEFETAMKSIAGKISDDIEKNESIFEIKTEYLIKDMDNTDYKPKSFWKRPEGVTGAIFLAGIVLGGGFLLFSVLPALVVLVQTALGLAVTLLVLGAIIYMALDPKMRNLVGYMYKSVMRSITGLFVKIDPIGILKSYVDDLKANLTKMNQQINRLRGQMHKLKELILNNQKEIKNNLEIASQAKMSNQQNVVILKSRKAGRLQESNMKYDDLYKKMEVLYRVLTKMYENSQIMQEDIADQVEVKEQERIAIRSSNSAMRSAMSVIKGDKDKRAMFDQALEAVADDVSQKVGEMERFMELSDNFMKSIDLQNGVFEEEGLKMLEKWEGEGVSKLLGSEKANLISKANDDTDILDLNAPLSRPEKVGLHKNQYDGFFED